MRRVGFWRSIGRPLAAGVALLFSLVMAPSAGSEGIEEYRVKAAFVYNFTKFVEWPPERFAADDAPIVIGVVRECAVAGELAHLVRERRVNGRAVSVVVVKSSKDVAGSHLVFVAAGDEIWFDALPKAARHGVLTVGESPRFATGVAMVNLLTVGGKVRFEINLDAAERAGLRLSAQLQKLALAIRRGS